MSRPPTIVLVEPQMGENIGAAARAMRNFGLSELRLVSPRDGWPDPKAYAVASGADAVLEASALYADLPSAIADFDAVYATTARLRSRPKPIFAPPRAMAEMRARTEAGARCAVLFGSERAGLNNSDILRAETLIHIPAMEGFLSLNLAQSVLVVAYEWRCTDREALAWEGQPPELAAGARQEDRERLVIHLIEELDAAGFFYPPERRDSMIESLRNLLHRIPVTGSELRMLRGVVHHLGRQPPR